MLFIDFFSVTIILQSFFITIGINLLPSKLLPLMAKKISFLFAFELSKAIPEKNWNILF